MNVLGIESSCDETGVALVESVGQGTPTLLAHALHTQIDMHQAYGGVVPELASRDHIRRVVPLVRQVMLSAGRTLDDIDVVAQPAAALARLGVLSDARGLYPRLTARENIVYYGRLHGMSPAAAASRAEALADTLEMRALLDRRTDGFSQGERMKTALARALVHDPPNIILDEPTNGLDVMATRALRDTLRRLRDEQGKCIVFCTHVMQEVQRLCDHVVVMAHGRTVASGSVAELCRRCGTDDFEQAFVSLAFDACPVTP